MNIILNAGPKSMEKNNVSETTLFVCLCNHYGYQGSFIHNKLKRLYPKHKAPTCARSRRGGLIPNYGEADS